MKYDAFAILLFAVLYRREDHSNSVMWVHDYHLMLLPKILSDREKEECKQRRTSIIFFLHIPFPTSQIFRSVNIPLKFVCRVRFISIVSFARRRIIFPTCLACVMLGLWLMEKICFRVCYLLTSWASMLSITPGLSFLIHH